ncbi:MAG: ParB N-terminal domain-containing protein [Nanoarchaeota archaeon]|nr:ParB N-terminal domain-containing protein [Nanoarchaeota archaeon]
MGKEIPEIIKNVGFDFHWDNKKVWELDINTEEIDIKELEWHFEIPFLDFNSSYDLSPNQVINNADKFKSEYDRTMKADLNYPIDIMFNKGQWLILDGLHRLMKAKILGMKKVRVRKVPHSKINEILKD